MMVFLRTTATGNRFCRQVNAGGNPAGIKNDPRALVRDGAGGLGDFIKWVRIAKGEGRDLSDGILTRFLQNYYLSLTTCF